MRTSTFTTAIVLLVILCSTANLRAQEATAVADSSWKKVYRATATRVHDLVHTRLDLRPDYQTQYLNGKAWITLQSHFYPADSVTLDAKGFEIKSISMMTAGRPKPLTYQYDELQLTIKLDRFYHAAERFTIFLEYIAKPNEFEAKYGENALLGIKGMYFIDPLDEDKEKPTQIWTQGETEGNSAWFPTIDKTNQKTTQELTITVPAKYLTLSNGKLISQKKNPDGTRTDYWKMDLPHAPYLFFLGVGEYAIIKDAWRGKEVNYYVEPEYRDVARKIFGNTPEMMTYFSKITGVDYPWNKYAQITGRDYVAGAMENTTATLHQNHAQQDARELVDENVWESTIAHELFHQWFGDYVTTESWSNITLNESFADYSETLWAGYKYGPDAGQAANLQGLQSYLASSSEDLDLVRFHYHHREDVFDAVSYQKGGRILHMLRNYVGDSAFFKAINLYLTTYKFRSAEAHQLRLIFEEVTGEDLNWFFDQWYFGSGHPIVEVSYTYDDAAGNARVILRQTQRSGKLFRMPFMIDVYNGPARTRQRVWMEHATDTFTLPYKQRPDLINVDGDRMMLWAKKDVKTLREYVHQYRYAATYPDRREAVDFASRKLDDPAAVALISEALKDPFAPLREMTLNRLNLSKPAIRKAFEPLIAELARTDKSRLVRASAIGLLASLKEDQYKQLFLEGVRDSSYSVAGASLDALTELAPDEALVLARELNGRPAKGLLKNAIMTSFARSGDASMFDAAIANFGKLDMQSKFSEVGNIADFLRSLKDPGKFRTGIEGLYRFRDGIPDALKSQTDPYLNGLFESLLQTKTEELKASPDDGNLKEQVSYLQEKIGKKAS